MYEADSILAVLPGALGDVINTVPALKALRSSFPRARIEAAGSPERMNLLAACGIVDGFHDINVSGFHALFSESPDPSRETWDFIKGFDLVVSWLYDTQGLLERNLAAAGIKAVFFKQSYPLEPDSGPASASLSLPVLELGVKDIPSWPSLEPPDDFVKIRAGILGEDFGAFLAVHPGSGSKSKCWPAKNFAQAANDISRAYDLGIAVIEGPADVHLTKEMTAGVHANRVSVIKDRQAVEVAAVLSGASLYVGNDSGISHLASALGIPSVVVFGPTDPDVWAPRQPWASIIKPAVDCAPCDDETRRHCENRICLEQTTPERVISLAGNLYANPGK